MRERAQNAGELRRVAEQTRTLAGQVSWGEVRRGTGEAGPTLELSEARGRAAGPQARTGLAGEFP